MAVTSWPVLVVASRLDFTAPTSEKLQGQKPTFPPDRAIPVILDEVVFDVASFEVITDEPTGIEQRMYTSPERRFLTFLDIS